MGFSQDLEGDQAMELCVLSIVCDTHPARTHLLQNAVRDGLARSPEDAWLAISSNKTSRDQCGTTNPSCKLGVSNPVVVLS